MNPLEHVRTQDVPKMIAMTWAKIRLCQHHLRIQVVRKKSSHFLHSRLVSSLLLSWNLATLSDRGRPLQDPVLNVLLDLAQCFAYDLERGSLRWVQDPSLKDNKKICWKLPTVDIELQISNYVYRILAHRTSFAGWEK